MAKLLVTVSALAALAVVGSAHAADLPVKAPPMISAAPVFNWTGCYIGGNIGAAWSRQDADSAVPLISDQAPGFVTLGGSSVIGGAHIGCNYQFAPSFVAGIEGDWSATRLSDTQTLPNLLRNGVPVGNGGISFSHETTWLASVRGRLGVVASPNMLLYVTGGVAWNNTNYADSDIFNGGCPNCAANAFSVITTGWVAGGGAEWAPWNNNWLIRAEFLYYRFAGATDTPVRLAFPLAPPTFTWHDNNIGEVRLGVSYKFGGGPIVAKY